ncbi:MAG: ABC transporter permease, partial [Pseudomonadota bacterium]
MSISQGVFDGGEGAPPAKSAAVIEEELGAARRRRMLLIAQIGVGIGILAFWQIASGWLIDGFFISSPDAVAAQLWRWFSSGSIWGNLYQTLYAMVFGFAIGA